MPRRSCAPSRRRSDRACSSGRPDSATRAPPIRTGGSRACATTWPHLLVTLTAWNRDQLDERATNWPIASSGRWRPAPGPSTASRALRGSSRALRVPRRRGPAPGLGVDPPGHPGHGHAARSRWQPLPVGEFVLGHLDAEGVAEHPPRSTAGRPTARTWCCASSTRTSPASARSSTSGSRLPRRARPAGGQARRTLARRHPLALSPDRARSRPSRRTRPASTTSASPTTRTACAARSAPTSAGPTPATGPAWAGP